MLLLFPTPESPRDRVRWSPRVSCVRTRGGGGGVEWGKGRPPGRGFSCSFSFLHSELNFALYFVVLVDCPVLNESPVIDRGAQFCISYRVVQAVRDSLDVLPYYLLY